MNLLAIDAACSACSAALLQDDAITAHCYRAMQRGHVEALMPIVATVLRDSGAGYSDLHMIAVTVGPGSLVIARRGGTPPCFIVPRRHSRLRPNPGDFDTSKPALLRPLRTCPAAVKVAKLACSLLRAAMVR